MAAVAIRGTTYPVVLPKLRDPRLHLAATITSLQVLGQVAFHFRVSIAQILLCLGTAGVIEVALTLRKQRVIMWPASALLTGNGVAFVLRVPGTQHGDWWSLRGWWIFMATAGGALLSKHVIQWKGTHWFNPSNIGLVVCFLALGRGRVEPLDFWWGPMSWWMVLALAIIVTGGFAILSRLRLLRVALCFWASFALSIGVLALAGHAMTARWHLGPITGLHFWWVLVTSPEVLVFLFFMITDPKTAPADPRQRVVYAASLGVLAGVLIAPTTTEFAAKVALLSSLAIVCAVKPWLRYVPRRALVLAAAPALALGAGVLVLGNGTSASRAAPSLAGGRLPPITILPSPGVQTQLTMVNAQLIAHGLLAAVPGHTTDTLRVHLVPGTDQSPPTAVAVLAGSTYHLHLTEAGTWALSAGSARPQLAAAAGPKSTALAGTHLSDVAASSGIDFQQGSFHYGVTNDVEAMMGGGVCWLDYNGDGWQDLFVVNSYSSADADAWRAHGGLPESQLYENDHGTFHDATGATHAGLAVQGDGCAAADLNGDGHTDLVVTTSQGVEVLWNDGHGAFSRSALWSRGWYTGTAVADVNGDGRPDIFAAGYADPNEPVPNAIAGFPTNLTGVRDLLFLNEGNGRFREVGAQAGLETTRFRHGLGAQFLDVNGDGRPDLYVANDEDPNDLYVDVPWPGGAKADPAGLGFRFDERADSLGVADRFAGMGIASSQGLLLVTNSRNEPSAVFSGRGGSFANARSLFDPALGTGFAGWGASFVDLANSGRPDLVLAAGAIPVKNLAADAEPLRVLAPASGGASYGNAAGVLASASRVNGRGLAAADAGNDGRMEIAVNTIGGKLLLLRATGPSGHWLDIALSRFVPGAVVTATFADGRTRTSRFTAGSSYLSSEDPRIHFGLGEAASLTRLAVRYPWGATTVLRNVAADRVVTVTVPAFRAPTVAAQGTTCTPRIAHGSAATVWDETGVAVLRASALPEPVQARDLYQLATVMRDAAPYGARAVGTAAYRLLLWQASLGSNLEKTFRLLRDRAASQCAQQDARGARIAAAAIRAGRHDGSLEAVHFDDSSYVPQNAPLVVSQPGSTVHDATFWQPLAGQTFVGAQWGHVRTFAGLVRAPAPPFGTPDTRAYKAAAVAVIRATAPAHLPARVDASPLAWNEIAAAHAPGRLVADARFYFTLNAALNDTAVSAWNAKRAYQAPRPISMIRYLAFNDELPLTPGLVEKRGGQIVVREEGRWVRGDRWTPPAATPASPGWVSEASAFSAAATDVLRSLTGESFAAQEARLGGAGVAAGVETPADEHEGNAIGATVAARVLARLP